MGSEGEREGGEGMKKGREEGTGENEHNFQREGKKSMKAEARKRGSAGNLGSGGRVMLGIRRGSTCVERWMAAWTTKGARGRGIEPLWVRGAEGGRNGSGRRL